MIPDWCDKIDFFSLGTNDLTASSMGVDRDAQVSSLASHRYNPGVIRMIHSTIVSACQQGKPVTACGELASDPMGYWLLIALGVSSLSVPVRKIGDVVQFSQRYSKVAIQECKDDILKARSALELTRQFQQFGFKNPAKSKLI
jgi:phosphoenolpyruvate-protein kinase (PTS system EI component)